MTFFLLSVMMVGPINAAVKTAAKTGQIVIPLSYTSLVATICLSLLGVLVWWIRGMPERTRARNEGEGPLWTRITELERLRLEDRRQCAAETKELQDCIDELKENLNGVIRNFLQYQAAVARLHPELGAIALDDDGAFSLAEPLERLYHIASDHSDNKKG